MWSKKKRVTAESERNRAISERDQKQKNKAKRRAKNKMARISRRKNR